MAAAPLRIGLLCLFAATAATAADVKGSLGWTGFADEDTQQHLLTGGSVRIPIFRGFAIEPEVLYLKGSGRHHDLVLMPNLVWQWGRGRVRPYVIGGLGLIRSDTSGFSDTAGFISVGLGTKVYMNDRWFIAPEARLGWEPHARLSVGVGYTWRP
jgi:hypothetical protein